MGCAPMAHVLWSKIMNYAPSAPTWFNRDRFILSNGHACALLYSMLHLTGYDITMDQLKAFRQLHSVTAGHPENVLHPAIEVSTGPLGQGISNGVGMAVASKHLAAVYNKPGHELLNNFVYVLCGDGCLQEGVSSEASSLAGHLGLGNLIVLYDDNSITIDGSTDLSFTEDVLARYAAYGWHTLEVHEGDANVAAIEAAIKTAQGVTDKPSIIKVTTTIGFGSSKAGKASAHGSPLSADELAALKTAFGMDPAASFSVPDGVAAYYKEVGARGEAKAAAWQEALAAYTAAFPTEGAELTRRIAGELPAGWQDLLPDFSGKGDEATRSCSGKVLNALAGALPELMGGSADLTPSNKTLLKVSGDFQAGSYANRYLRFGVREHGMAALANGMAAYGGVLPYIATFLNFVGYAAGATRVGALSHLRVVYVATHDSIGLGEDGPTHQPVEMVTMLRAMPNALVLRPADGNETSAAYELALSAADKPSIICLSRQNLPQLEGSTRASATAGAYTVFSTAPEGTAAAAIIIATGSEVSLAIEAAKSLEGTSVSVVSAPCLEVFEEQTAEYKASVLPVGTPVVSVEASAITGWERYAHTSIGLRTFGLSAPAHQVYAELGITKEAVAARVAKAVEHFGSAAPALPLHLPEGL